MKSSKVSIYSDEGCFTPSKKFSAVIKKAVDAVLASEEIDRACAVSVTFVDGDTIVKLNRKYMGKSRVTDVLSFPALTDVSEASDADVIRIGSRKYLGLGDIVLYEKVIARHAKDFGNTFEEETVYMVIHSVLHLLGYDHAEKEENAVMTAKQEKIFASLKEAGLFDKL